jgi:hypothetical protein
LWERAFARASEIVSRHRHHIETLGDELARRGHLSGDEIKRVLPDAGFQTSASSASGLRYRTGTMIPRQQRRGQPRREIYAGGVRVGWIEALHDEHDGEELGFAAFHSDGELAGLGDDLVSAAQAL